MKRKHPAILLTSIFGPYARDDNYGSRRANPMELFHNQVTREQGPFSLRMFHRSWGLKFIQENIEEPSVLLDFPTRECFIAEIKKHPYKIIGISSIYVNFYKVKEMCRLIREIQPAATIVVGGHIAAMPDLKEMVGADHVVTGDGIRWFREFLKEDTGRPIRHPHLFNEISPRVMGVRIRESTSKNFAVVVPSVGCPMGCEFCSTSAMFGGKGKFINFYKTGDELFDVLCDIERHLKTRSFIVMDENFLLHKTRARRLLELIEQNNKRWSFFVFSSAHAVMQYSIDELVRLGIWMIWLGLECEDTGYEKLKSIDTAKLVVELRGHGIHVLGSTIIGMRGHAPKDIDAVIERAVTHKTDFHQFMLYMPLPGTPLHREYEQSGVLHAPGDFHIADAHGQYKFNYRHGSIEAGLENGLLTKAFQRDSMMNGPSIIRFFNTVFMGWKRYRNCPDERIKKRALNNAIPLLWFYPGVLWAAGRFFSDDNHMRSLLSDMRSAAKEELPWFTRLFTFFAGPFLYYSIRSEERRLKKGTTYEPPTFYEIRETID